MLWGYHFLTSGFKTLLELSTSLNKKHGKTVERASVLSHRRHLGKAILVVQAHCTKLISLCMQLLRFSAEIVSLLPRKAQAILCAMPVSAESYLLKYFPFNKIIQNLTMGNVVKVHH